MAIKTIDLTEQEPLDREKQRGRRDRIKRLRTRIDMDTTPQGTANVIRGILDLLADEL